MGEAASCSARHCHGVGQPYGLEIRTSLIGADTRLVLKRGANVHDLYIDICHVSCNAISLIHAWKTQAFVPL